VVLRVEFVGILRREKRRPDTRRFAGCLFYCADAIRKPAGLSRGGPAQGGISFLSLPTLFGFALLAIRVGLNNFALRRWFIVDANGERCL
jgi:hypothetical protein